MILVVLSLQLSLPIFDELEPVFPDTVFKQAYEMSTDDHHEDLAYEHGSHHQTDTGLGIPTAIHVFVPAEDGQEVVVEFSHYTFHYPGSFTEEDEFIGGGGRGGNSRSDFPSLSISKGIDILL